jgi:ATP synthase, F1 gamma subunit
MASLKDVRVKIGGVKKTKQITKAMNMVASAKLRGAQMRIERFRPYADKFYEVLGDLADKSDSSAHPLLERRAEPKCVGILLVTSDRGLCGSFNINLITRALALAKKRQEEGLSVRFYCIGRKGRDAVRRVGFEIAYQVVGMMNTFDFQLANAASNTLLHDFLEGVVDEAHIIYGQFKSIARQEATCLRLLPIAADKVAGEEPVGAASEYVYEPSVEALLAELLPRFVKVQVYRGMLDTSASEHAARMAAMDNATRNCDDIVSALTLVFNKTRQAAITTDLMDIVAGAEALNG